MSSEYSQHYQQRLATREGSARLQHRSAIDLNEARALAPGVAFLIRRGQRMKVNMARAPDAHVELPAPARTDGHESPPDPAATTEAAARELPY